MGYVLSILSEPLIPAILGFGVWLLVTRRRDWVAPGTGFVRRVAVIGAIVILLPYVAVDVLPVLDVAQRYLAPELPLKFSSAPFEYRWWAYPLPLVAAIGVVLVFLVHLARKDSTPEAPVTPITRRDWSTFARRGDVVAAVSALAALILVSVLAGLASITDRNGLHTLIALPGPDLVHDPGQPLPSGGIATFYGWAYSVPVMVAALVLAALAWWALHAASARPFRRPDTVEAETAERRTTAKVLLRLSTAAVLLPLGGALVQIGGAGQGSTGVGIPGVGTFMWSLGYSSFAPAISLVGALVQAAGVLALLIAMRGERRAARALEPVLP